MQIELFEQSGFIITSNSGNTLAVDIGNKTPLEKLAQVSVDTFLVSHIHGDHFSLPHISATNPEQVILNQECINTIDHELPFALLEIKADEQITSGDFNILAFDVDHGPNVSSPLQDNFGFLIEVDGKKLYFAGDMFYKSGIDVSALAVDYALIPVGTFYTFGPEEAYAFVQKFKSIAEIIPIHYEKTPHTREEFIALVDSK